MGIKDTLKKRRTEHLEKRAERANGPSASERARARIDARTTATRSIAATVAVTATIRAGA